MEGSRSHLAAVKDGGASSACPRTTYACFEARICFEAQDSARMRPAAFGRHRRYKICGITPGAEQRLKNVSARGEKGARMPEKEVEQAAQLVLTTLNQRKRDAKTSFPTAPSHHCRSHLRYYLHGIHYESPHWMRRMRSQCDCRRRRPSPSFLQPKQPLFCKEETFISVPVAVKPPLCQEEMPTSFKNAALTPLRDCNGRSAHITV